MSVDKDCVINIVKKHMEMLPNYNPNSDEDIEDKVEQGYGNACLNILREIEDDN